MKKKLIAVLTALFIGLIPFTANAEESSKDIKGEEALVDVFKQIESDINFALEHGIEKSETIYTQPIELEDGVELLSSETVIYNVDGTIAGDYSVKVQPEVSENIIAPRVVINTGGYDWKYVNTKYTDTYLEHTIKGPIQALLAFGTPYLPTIAQQSFAGGLSAYIGLYANPKLYYFKSVLYTDHDAVNNYYKLKVYTYKDKGRTKLESTKTITTKSKR
ncbi:hypothetical protein AN960_09535 [Bacillus sp. FJAT-25509]|uniref:hypothetical protein n=1 Tax=Bacillus sp. FJAT-25509 TaxID=1712029 RepID=UPI0007008E0F|nr:hypothetical protein [Bacillus sp. FJAT-25509]KQL39207.1 hypothetical protein AN960_09535 [Bacillus sp. FJAT-25509]